ncbi:TonB-dependent receptor [Croceicoccus hydrothermalis]|uniref:TonB-dependent receptor n=1 Tax=Croceicoccus hydrothermalis TaxID=2867964 RepID=UPI001EFA3B05|nr:TonB-dependent receptor [Croceicoccus hydrothermalis]
MPYRICASTTLVLASLASSLSAQTAQARPDDTRRADTSFSVDSIVVTARGRSDLPDTILTSVDRLDPKIAQRSDVGNVYELVGQMPGVQVTEFNQGTTGGKFSFRAFNGEGTINGVKLLIDGVPSNENNGNMPFIDAVFPLHIRTIEVVRGTSDPRYGLHNIAGSANILTRTGGSFIDARVSAGSFATVQAQAAVGLETRAVTQNYFAGYRDSNGYREHSESERLSLGGKWRADIGLVTLGAVARYYEAEVQEPGYLTFAASRADPRQTNSFNATDGGTRDLRQYALTLESGLAQGLSANALGYHNRVREDRFVKFSASAQQQRRLTREDQFGLRASLRWQTTGIGIPLAVQVGGDIEWQDNRSLRWLTTERRLDRQTRDQQFGLSTGSIYVQAEIEPARWLRITPAYRVDWVGGDFENRLNRTTAPINDYGTIEQPRLSIAVLPSDNLTLYGSYGRTFQIGLGSGAYLIAPRTRDLAPSVNEGFEAGIAWRRGKVFEARAAYWEQSATGEIARRLNDPLGDFENVGATYRRGVDVQGNLRPLPGLSLWGALAWQEARIDTPDPASPQLAGNALDHVPGWLWSAGAEYGATARLLLGMIATGQSDYFLTTANAEGRWGRSALCDATATYDLTDRFALGLTVRNLMGDYNEYVWFDGSQTLHSPGEGRSAFASIRTRF